MFVRCFGMGIIHFQFGFNGNEKNDRDRMQWNGLLLFFLELFHHFDIKIKRRSIKTQPFLYSIERVYGGESLR